MLSHLGIAVCKEKCRHGHAIFEALKVAAAIESLQRVGGVVLVGTQEGLEAELVGVCALEQGLDEVEIVLLEQLRLVVLVFHQVVHFFFQVVEVDGVLVDVLEEELVRGLTVLVELNLAVLVIQVEQCVQRVIVQLLFRLHRFGDGLTQLRGHDVHGPFFAMAKLERRKSTGNT